MKKYFLFSILVISINLISQNAISEEFLDRCKHDNCYMDRIEKMISIVLPEGSKVESIEKSEFPGIYKVYFGDLQPLYVSKDGKYFIYGQMFKINWDSAGVGAYAGETYKSLTPNIDNLTDLDILEKRLSLMQEIESSELISFKSNKQLYELTVFTDVDCGYCRKFHSQIQAYNELGIQVNYLAFPRQGLASEAGQKIISAWCSTEKNKSLTLLKQGEDIEMKNCLNNPVESHYILGRSMGVQGTPAILKDDGTIIPGFIEPDRLIKLLN